MTGQAAPATPPVLVARGLQKSFGGGGRWSRHGHATAAVRGVDLEVAPGETLAIVGESGAGKSTVGRLVLRLIEADGGHVEILGCDVRQLSKRRLREFRRHASIVFQDPYACLDPKMLVGASVAEPLQVLCGMARRPRTDRVVELFEAVGLGAHHTERYPYEFSGGQLQRIAIARALATSPSLVVCDEPVAALDMSIQAQVINLLRELQSTLGVSYLFISHDLSLVRVIAHRVAVMCRGEIVEQGPVGAIFGDPQHEYTRLLLSSIPTADPRRRTWRAPAARGESMSLP